MSNEANELLKEIAKGNQKSFKALYEKVSPKLLGLLTEMLRDRYIAEDVLQETMVNAWNNSVSFDENKASATTWIFSIARHRALDRLRQQHRYDALMRSDNAKVDAAFSDIHDHTTFDYDSLLMSEKLTHCFEEIGNDSAACIRLAYYRGYTLREIALIRKNSVNTVKSWVKRGLAKLRECIQK